jgi:lycopene cyclase domain-containing protein
MPEYTISLLLWIAPVVGISIFFHFNKTLKSVQLKALVLNLIIFAGIGFVLDLAFAHRFFTFPDPAMTLGIKIRNIPVEEFLFYLFGFWFIVFFYAFNDEFFLRKYNKDDRHYINYARRIKKMLVVFCKPWHCFLFVTVLAGFVLLKHRINPAGPILPGYLIFLSISAYVPFIFFWRLTRTFVNVRALVLVVTLTSLISIIWEVTLALPRGYWNYNHDYMLGIFIHVWDSLPIEAVTVWIFCSLIILCYEYTKICLHRRNLARAKQRNALTWRR